MLSLHDRQTHYARARDHHGMTVEEWEAASGLPPFTVYPHARSARYPDDAGFFMYADREAVIAEEDRQMACLRRLGVPATDVAALYDYGARLASKPEQEVDVAARRAERAEARRLAADDVAARPVARHEVRRRRAERRADREEARRRTLDRVTSRQAEHAEAYRQMGCLRALGIPLKEVAALYRTSMAHVIRRAGGRVEREKESAAHRDHREEENRQMVCLRRLGIRLHEIAAIYGCVKANVCMRTKRLM